MRHPVLICSIFATIIAATCSKSIGFEEEDETGSRFVAIRPELAFTIQNDQEPLPRLNRKRNLETVQPGTKKIEEKMEEGFGPKAKRCKMSRRSEKASIFYDNGQTVLRAVNPDAERTEEREFEDAILGLNPTTMPIPVSEETAKNLTFRDEDLINSLRRQLTSQDEMVGASLGTSEPNIRVIDETDYVCYCAEKPRSSLRRYKGDRRNENRRITVPTGKQPKRIGQKVAQQRPASSNDQISEIKPDNTRFRSNNAYSGFQYGDQDRTPYIPYVYNTDPRIPTFPRGFQGSLPTRMDVPFKPDTILGQREPSLRQGNLGIQKPDDYSELVGETWSESPENHPSVSLLESYSPKCEQDTFNYNLPTNRQFQEPSETVESFTDAPLVGARDPEPYSSATEATINYSNVEESTSYFTLKPYESENSGGSPSMYDYPTEEDENGNVGPEDRVQMRKGDSVAPAKAQNNLETFRNTNSYSQDDNKGSNDLVGEGNPKKLQENWSNRGNARHDTENFKQNGREYETDEPFTRIQGTTEFTPTDYTISDYFSESTEYSRDYGSESPEMDNNYETRNMNDEENIEPSLSTERTISEDSTNTDPIENKETTIKPSDMAENVALKNPSDESLPFCDNTLLQKSIKTVINKFGDNDEDSDQETVGSSMDEDLRPDIVKVPNLKGIVSLPEVERAILENVKNLLSTKTGVARKNFDSDWATNVIRNNLKHTLAAAPDPDTERSSMTVEEHELKDGKWVTKAVTLEPITENDSQLSDTEKLSNSVKNILRNPAVTMEAAKNPIVQNMLVESVRKSLKPTNAEAFDESVVRNALNNELNGLELENEGPDATVIETQPITFDPSNIDVNKFLDIARNEAGMNGGKFENEKDDLLGAVDTMSSEPPKIQLPVEPGYGKGSTDFGSNVVSATPTNDVNLSKLENVAANQRSYFGDANESDDFTYLGKISVKNNTDGVKSLKGSELFYIGDGVKLPLEIRKLEDGAYALSISRKVCEHLLNKECPCCVPVNGNIVRTVKRNTEDRYTPEQEEEERKKITKRDTGISDSSKERKESDSDDNLQILSMPVETFAKRYNLSLNLGKLETSRNLNEWKIHGLNVNQTKYKKNHENDERLRYSLIEPISTERNIETSTNDDLEVNGDTTNFEFQRKEERKNIEKYRYERNTDEIEGKRAEIVRSILNWIRDIILSTRNK